MKRIQICADDYGFDAAVSLGILDCIDAGRISATSCMVLSPAWGAWAPALRERAGAADYGLHLDLNEFADYAQRDLAGWIAAAYLGVIKRKEARHWINICISCLSCATHWSRRCGSAMAVPVHCASPARAPGVVPRRR